MPKNPLNDQTVFPTNDIVFDILGKAAESWRNFRTIIAEKYPHFASEWGYYNDVKHWYYKVSTGKKTVCWVSIQQDEFEVTFFFNKKKDYNILQSRMPKQVRDMFLAVPDSKKNWGISMTASKKSDVKLLESLLRLKDKSIK